MLPFCGYNMADYFNHWLSFADNHDEKQLPKIFLVNWFRKGEDGRWLWPGFGENSRVLEWVFNRVSREADAVDTPIGLLPTLDSLDVTGVNVSADDMAELLNVSVEDWRREVPGIREYYAEFAERLPDALHAQVDELEARLG